MHTTIYYSRYKQIERKMPYIKEYEVDSYDESTLYCKRRMKSMQFNVDTIANNLANVNTYAYKRKELNLKICYMSQWKEHICWMKVATSESTSWSWCS